MQIRGRYGKIRGSYGKIRGEILWRYGEERRARYARDAWRYGVEIRVGVGTFFFTQTKAQQSLSHESHYAPRQEWAHLSPTALHSDMQSGNNILHPAHLQLLSITGRKPPHSLLGAREHQWLVAHKEVLGEREHTTSTGKESSFGQSDGACMIIFFFRSPLDVGKPSHLGGTIIIQPPLDVGKPSHLGGGCYHYYYY